MDIDSLAGHSRGHNFYIHLLLHGRELFPIVFGSAVNMKGPDYADSRQGVVTLACVTISWFTWELAPDAGAGCRCLAPDHSAVRLLPWNQTGHITTYNCYQVIQNMPAWDVRKETQLLMVEIIGITNPGLNINIVFSDISSAKGHVCKKKVEAACSYISKAVIHVLLCIEGTRALRINPMSLNVWSFSNC